MPNTDTSFLAVVTLRNEGAFILDWLAHHRAIGFTDFLVFSNDCDDGTDLILDRLAAMGQITHCRNEGPFPQGPQWAALKAADTHPLTAKADWVMALDIDEYVNIHVGDRRLADLTAALPEATAIPLTWRLFGNAGVVRYEDRPITEVFTRAAPAVMGWPWRAALFKTLFRHDGSYGKLGVHRPRQPDLARMATQAWFDGSGRELPAVFHRERIFSPFGQDNYQIAQLNHYPLGAMESYVLKCDRGRANREASAFDMSYWVERNFTEAEDRTLAVPSAQCTQLKGEYLGDSILARLHGDAVAWRKQRFQKLMEDEEYRSLFGRMLMTPPSRVLTMAESQFLFNFARRAQNPPARETNQ
ncbi:MAG: glycosyltransferase family 2 protein [Albidovulum sp.]